MEKKKKKKLKNCFVHNAKKEANGPDPKELYMRKKEICQKDLLDNKME